MRRQKIECMKKQNERPWRLLEKHLIMDVIESRKLSMFSGKYLELAEQRLEEIFPGRKVLLLNSGTIALHIALKCLGIGPGDEVIVPAVTYPATALAVIHAGATPVFADIDACTFTLDETSCRRIITQKTKAIIFVHLFGVMGMIEKISGLCAEKGLYLVEDCAQAFGSKLKGKMAGTFGEASCFSFFETKTISAGEGGALILKNSNTIDKARRYRHHGMDVQVNDRTVSVEGFNAKPSEFQSALILSQLTYYKEIISFRQKVVLDMRKKLSKKVEFQSIGAHECVSPDKLCVFLKPTKQIDAAKKIISEYGGYKYLTRPLFAEPVFSSSQASANDYHNSVSFCNKHFVLPLQNIH